MANISKTDRRRKKEKQAAALNRREIISAQLSRRDMVKMGLLTSAGLLVSKTGLSARAMSRTGFAPDGQPNSPPTRAFIEDMPRLTIKQPVAALNPAPTIAPNTAAGEGRTVSHQAFAQFPPQKFYEMHQQAANVSMSPDLPLQPIWGFDGITPGPLFVARYGEPILVRQRNDLPLANGGFGKPSVTTHLHNGHTPPESDGFPCFFFERGQFYDHHYPNVLAGINSTHPGTGDINEAMSSLWYHDHRIDFTSQNTYKGLAGMYNLFNQFDSGDETTGFRLPSFPDFDINMVFNDKVFDQQTGLLAFDTFNFDGILGDKFLVNGKINPVLHVSPRRYRFRWLNTGPSRFYQLFLTDLTNLSAHNRFYQISVDGNLLPRPVLVESCRFSVAERVDVIIDFTGKAGKTFYLENRLDQQDGRGPSGDILAAGQGNKILKIVVDGPVVADNSIDPALITQFYALPSTTPTPLVTRTFKFERDNGMWAVNGRFADCNETRFRVKRNTVEKWILQNSSGGWQHPVHIHFEEFQTLSINGQPPSATEIVQNGRKDVLRLEHNSTAVLFFRFRDFVGRLPIHCHNVVHEDHAMMALWAIDDVGDNNPNP
jgi:FtsP/CotA-like multicopper oxidase with cupredoxin domain